MAKTVTKPKKAAKKKPRKKAAKVTWNPDKKLTDKEELFCRYYVQNEGTRLNAAQSYNLAYDKKLEEQDREDAITGTREDGTEYIEKESSYNRVNNVCRSEASKLLSKPNINARKIVLLNEMLTNDVVDAELMKVINQDGDRPSKIRAINEYNKLGSRIEEKKSIMHSFGNDDVTDAELRKSIADQEKFFNKK